MDKFEANIAYSDWFYDCKQDEFDTYIGFGDRALDACAFVKCIFLDLIDHSEAE